ncbi:MAG: LysM peptidoglycan-binding domain-containing protein [Neisseria sp.]|nr:LysM peptidoglycan-binding domain-containing protein [Neisseria sp.]
MSSLKTIAMAIAGLTFLSAAQAQTYTAEQIRLAMIHLHATPMDYSGSGLSFGGGSVWHNLRNNFRMAEVNSELVRRHESKFMSNSAYFNRTMERSRPYMYHISTEVAKRNMPAEIALLPFIESAFVTKAKSHVGASGLWQFMPATGRHYGLEQTPLYDGRHDIYAATDAALNYLQYLYGLFGDWSLALAAYNWGEGNVGKAINRAMAQGLAPTYENLKMPAETRNYVPKLLAVRNIVSNPNAFGVRFSDVENKPYFQAVNLSQPIDISAAARLAQISETEFLSLNPAFKSPVYIPKSGRKMLLPASAAQTFERNYNKADKASLLSWDVYTPSYATSLLDIASQSGMSVEQLKSLNGLRSNNIASGQSILVSKNALNGNTAFQTNSFASLDIDRNPSDNRLQTVPPIANRAFTPSTPAPAITVEHVITPAPAVISAQVQTASNRINSAPIQASVIERAANRQTHSSADIQIERVANTVNINSQNRITAQTSDIQEVRILRTPNPTPTLANTATQVAPVQVVKSATVQAQEARTATAQIPTTQVRPTPVVIAQTQAARTTPVQIAQIQPTNTAPVQQFANNPAPSGTGDALLDLVQNVQSTQTAYVAPQQMAVQTANRAQVQPVAANTRPAPAAIDPNANSHRVVAGDTLFNISQRYNMSVAELAAANNIYDNTIKLGQVLKVGAAARAARSNGIPASYTVRQGETLSEIARRYNLKVSDLQRLNNGQTQFQVGQKIRLQGI